MILMGPLFYRIGAESTYHPCTIHVPSTYHPRTIRVPSTYYPPSGPHRQVPTIWSPPSGQNATEAPHLHYLSFPVAFHASLGPSSLPGTGASLLSAAKTSVVSAAKTSALSAAKTSALSAAKASALKTAASSHISMPPTTTSARRSRAHVVVYIIEM